MARATPLRVAWLTTGRGPGSYGALEYVLESILQGLPVEIAVAFVNRAPGDYEATDRLIDMVRSADIPLEALSSVAFRKAHGGRLSKPGEALPAWRREFDSEVASRLQRHDFSIGVMFGYMLIATEPLFDSFPMLNDHPALPDGPVGTYQEVIHQLMASRATESGCMMNLVTAHVDRGPAISYCRYSIRDEENQDLWERHPSGLGKKEAERSALFTDLRARGIRRERPFVVETLRVIAEGELQIPPPEPVDLTVDVEAGLG
ncbi:MAG TPA: formyltransferase family protein [Dehalococcoidia bacterium]|nr:formyltransferase family protein [Dehalococcoidia bacterium]